MTPTAGLCAGDLAHGVMEGQAEDLDMEVNGVAGQVGGERETDDCQSTIPMCVIALLFRKILNHTDLCESNETKHVSARNSFGKCKNAIRSRSGWPSVCEPKIKENGADQVSLKWNQELLLPLKPASW